MRVYHSDLIGRYIDLDHILAISDAYFVDRMGSGGHFVQFEIMMAFLNEPLTFTYPLKSTEENYSVVEGEWSLAYVWEDEHHFWIPRFVNGNSHYKNAKLLCVKRIQDQIDGLVKMWRMHNDN